MMMMKSKLFLHFSLLSGLISSFSAFTANTVLAREMTEYPRAKLQYLDKVTARTTTFEADIGTTMNFGTLYVRVQSCQRSSPVDQPESAAFLQIWEATEETSEKAKSEWVFSGWMFASSPGLSPMDHPVYDVWVLDCLEGDVVEEAMEEVEQESQDEVKSQDIPEE